MIMAISVQRRSVAMTVALYLFVFVDMKTLDLVDGNRLKRDTSEKSGFIRLESQVGELRDQIQQLQAGHLEEMEILRSSHRHEMATLQTYHKSEMDRVWSHADMMCDGSSTQTSRVQSGGAVYTRWGRTTCPENDTETVYIGYVGGGHYSHSGGAAEYLCLPPDPQWGKYDDEKADSYGTGYIYGAEYHNSRGTTTLFGENLHGNDVPCAMCRVTSRTTVLMIPGRRECYSGWKREYHGYLMSGHYSHTSSTQYVCVEENPETVPGSNAVKIEKLLFPVEGVCGSLPCPPYVNGREFTCVVCSI